MDKIYFAGGMYFTGDKLEFKAVSPTGGLPYITKNENGLALTSHHSSLYFLSEDGSAAFLHHKRMEGVGNSPLSVKLPLDLQWKIKNAIAQDLFFD